MLAFTRFRLDVADERLWKDGEELRLRRKPFSILSYLAAHPQHLVTQDELVNAVWGKVAMSESLLRTHVRELRQTLGEGVIETVVGRGYRFVPAVQKLDPGRAETHEVPAFTEESTSQIVVGRDAELDALGSAFRSALERRRQTLFVAGEPGIGKTALVDAFVERVRKSTSVFVARGASVENYGSAEAYLPVLDALMNVSRGPSGESVVGALARHAPSWLAQMPGLVRDDQVEILRSRVLGTTQARTLRELAEALEAVSSERPLVLVLEDLQWSDDATTALVAMLAQRREPARLLVIGTYRTADVTKAHPLQKTVGELGSHRQASVLSLASLGESDVRSYFASRYPLHKFPSELAATVEQMTGGNPMFFATLLDDLEKLGLIRSVDGRFRLEGTVLDVSARRPETTKQLIDIQVDRLEATDQRILEAAGIAGPSFTPSLLAHALDIAVDDADCRCEALADQHRFLRHVGTEDWPDGTSESRYAFVHALYQDAVAARSPSAIARQWHRRIAERIEALHGEGAENVAAELASHFEAGQSYRKAAHYYLRAGERAAKRSGLTDALRQLQRARDLVARLPASTDRDELELRVLERLAPTSLSIDVQGTTEVDRALARSVELAVRLGNSASLAASLGGLQQCRLARGMLSEVESHMAEHLAVAHATGDPFAEHQAHIVGLVAQLFRGRLNQVDQGLEEVLAWTATSSDSEQAHAGYVGVPAVMARASLGNVRWFRGFPDRALEVANEAVAKGASIGEPFSQAMALSLLAGIHMNRREPEKTLEVASRALTIANDEGFVAWKNRPFLLAQWARVAMGAGDAGALIDEMERTLSCGMGAGPATKTFYKIPFVDLCIRAGRTDRALREVDEAIAFALERGERAWEPELHRLRGVLLQDKDAEEARRSYENAIALAAEQSSRSFELRALVSLYRFDPSASVRERLRAVYGSFTEGFDTADLVEARALLV